MSVVKPIGGNFWERERGCLRQELSHVPRQSDLRSLKERYTESAHSTKVLQRQSQLLITSGLNHAAHSGMLGEGLAASLITKRLRHILGPDAKAISVEGNVGPVSAGKGTLLILRGEDFGFHKFSDLGIGLNTPSAGVAVQVMNLYSSAPNVFAESFYGIRLDFNVGLKVMGAFSLNATYSKNVDNQGSFIIGGGASYGFGASILGFSAGINTGTSAKNWSEVLKPFQTKKF